jgi:hypothetical protein
MRNKRGYSVLAVAVLLSGCTSGQVGRLPVTTVNPFAGTTLQFAVGTFRYSPGAGPYANGATFLNMMETFRNAQGHSAVTYDVPMVAGPPQFVVGSYPLYDGLGPNQLYNSLSPAFGDNFGSEFFGTNPVTGKPYAPIAYIGGPPAFPSIKDDPSAYPSGFAGYSEGIIQPSTVVAGAGLPGGTYRLQLTVPSGPPPDTLGEQLNASLANLTPLGNFSAPQFVPDGRGGGIVSIVAPAGVVETLVNVTGSDSFTVVLHGAGPQSTVLPDALGPPDSNGHATPSIPSGKIFTLYALGVNYPAYEAAYPKSSAAAPVIRGADKQADVVLSPQTVAVYP